MAARATGSGVISFGMVSIPIKLYSTVDSTKSIRFNMLRKDGSRLKQQYIAEADDKLVPREDRVKGYEFSKGQYVLFSDEEMKSMDVKSTNEIEIHEFIPADMISATYVEKVNYLGPDKGAARSYHLLAEAMRKTGKSALAKYAARGKCYLVLIHPIDDGLIMIQLRHQEELRMFSDVEVPPADIQSAELDLAIQLVEQVSSDEFNPENYRDEIRHHMLEMIDRKVNGQEIVMAPEEHAESKIIDIMEALKASLKTEAKAAPKKAKRAPKRQAGGRKKASR
ncbi:MAG: Ku protein [Pseudomonadales bacterium]|jgi:DNA end-binding protein Ku|nr:Ku protein [Pseudomonadales bacterium]MDP7357544.1 Ku protein [Pseudomonadales bacterium]MDP7597857.1 Ku protein [Pseudomonadales bacterium]HJN51093.1 Ku protein [Pseudomonadales bacterium]|tara:strand:+ start:732 stop:1574 length:843 start_codon:yes stop_codon:yes gene_type:complete